jgi:PAS domain-containing protein
MESDSQKQMPEPKPEEVSHLQPEWCRVTPGSIGDSVIITNGEVRVAFLNPVAQSLTGWTQEDAAGKPLDIVFGCDPPTVHRDTVNAEADARVPIGGSGMHCEFVHVKVQCPGTLSNDG